MVAQDGLGLRTADEGIDRTTQDEKLLAAPLSHPEDQFEEAEVEESFGVLWLY